MHRIRRTAKTMSKTMTLYVLILSVITLTFLSIWSERNGEKVIPPTAATYHEIFKKK